MVKLVFGLHYMSQGGDQREFWDGEAKVWTSPLCPKVTKRSHRIVEYELGLYHRGRGLV